MKSVLVLILSSALIIVALGTMEARAESSGLGVPSPSPKSSLVYQTHAAGLGGVFCFSAWKPDGKHYVHNGANAFTLRLNRSRGGYDQVWIERDVVSLDPRRIPQWSFAPSCP